MKSKQKIGMKRLDGLLLTLSFLLLFSASGFRAAAQTVSGKLLFMKEKIFLLVSIPGTGLSTR